jgi:hypothetical protein
MNRLSPFGCTPVILALGVASIITCLIPTDDNWSNLLKPQVRVFLSIMVSIVFLLPVYIVSVLIAKKKIVLHLVIALLTYLFLWSVLLASELSGSFSLLIQQVAYRTLSYGSLYIVFFVVMLLMWRFSTFRQTQPKTKKANKIE